MPRDPSIQALGDPWVLGARSAAHAHIAIEGMAHKKGPIQDLHPVGNR